MSYKSQITETEPGIFGRDLARGTRTGRLNKGFGSKLQKPDKNPEHRKFETSWIWYQKWEEQFEQCK